MAIPPRVVASCILSASVIVAGCTVNSAARVAGWPELQVVEHKVSDQEVQARCGSAAAPGMRALACAQFNFRESRCDIWYAGRGPLNPFVLAHERGHCEGHDHVGQSAMERALKAYRERSG